MSGRSPTMGCLGTDAPSECKVYDWLVQSASCNQTKESINEFLNKTEKFKLAKAEKLNIINLRPSNPAIIDPIIEYGEKRLAKDDAKCQRDRRSSGTCGSSAPGFTTASSPPRSEDEMQGQEEMPTEKPMEVD